MCPLGELERKRLISPKSKLRSKLSYVKVWSFPSMLPVGSIFSITRSVSSAGSRSVCVPGFGVDSCVVPGMMMEVTVCTVLLYQIREIKAKW